MRDVFYKKVERQTYAAPQYGVEAIARKTVVRSEQTPYKTET